MNNELERKQGKEVKAYPKAPPWQCLEKVKKTTRNVRTVSAPAEIRPGYLLNTSLY